MKRSLSDMNAALKALENDVYYAEAGAVGKEGSGIATLGKWRIVVKVAEWNFTIVII